MKKMNLKYLIVILSILVDTMLCKVLNSLIIIINSKKLSWV